MPEYVLILIFLFLVSFFLHRTFKIKVFNNTKHLLIVYTVTFVVGVIWDNYAIARGHWVFGEKFLLGPHIGFMPIEEYGFIIAVSYFGLVVYRIAEKYTK